MFRDSRITNKIVNFYNREESLIRGKALYKEENLIII